MDWKKLKEQQPVTFRVLRHALDRQQLAHAYLLEGPDGTGKEGTALLLAQTLFCEAPIDGEPCGDCRNCRRIISGNHPDVIRIIPEEGAATIKKEQVAYLMKEFAYHGTESARRIFIIERAEKMTVQAENSLLKFIEEPYPGTLALLTTEHMHQMLDTIVSRCQILTFVPLSDQVVETELERAGQPHNLARTAAELTHDRDEAGNLCADPWFAGACSIVLQLVKKLGDSAHAVLPFVYEQLAPVCDSTPKVAITLDLVLFWYRDLLSLQLNRSEALIYDDQTEVLKSQMLRYSPDQLVQAMSFILEARKQLDAHVNGLSVLERLTVKLGGIH